MRSTVTTLAGALAIIGIGLAVSAATPEPASGLKPVSDFVSIADEKQRSLAIFAEWLFYMIAGSTIFVFRHREPDAPRPYRVWGYPLVPAIFVTVSAALLYYTFTDNLKNSALGLAAILAGIPVFYFFARRRARAAAAA